jgi:hypothetical protein
MLKDGTVACGENLIVEKIAEKTEDCHIIANFMKM